MKLIVFFIFALAAPIQAVAQDSINPYQTQLPNNIILQNTDVYYCPYAPPGTRDVRGYLSSVSDIVRDPNGVGDYWTQYFPVVWNSDSSKWDTLKDWSPCGTPLGQNASWQRYFTARDKPDGSHSDIIVGSNVVSPDTVWVPGLDGYPGHWEVHYPPSGSGPVIISKNEDVDFRASGTIKLENGFHVMPGAFFHAYIEPRWDTTVFADDFADSTLDRNKWMVYSGSGEKGECSTDSNVIMDTDYQAFDGHVVNIVAREDTAQFSCTTMKPDWIIEDCAQVPEPGMPPSHFYFSSATLMACPWPLVYSADSPRVAAYPHTPFGKYEIREKIPHIRQHTNNWGGASSFEYGINESWNPAEIHPGFGGSFVHGPCKGVFDTIGGVHFRSPAFTPFRWHPLDGIIIDHVLYDVDRDGDSGSVKPGGGTRKRGGFPASLTSRTDSITFYYRLSTYLQSDTVIWKVDTDAAGKWRILSAPYRVLAPGDSLKFTKAYQPAMLKLQVMKPDSFRTVICYWDSALNSHGTDTGYLMIDSYDALSKNELHIDTGQYEMWFWGYAVHGAAYRSPTDSIDTAKTDYSWAHSSYRYHTFTMEWLPNEVRFLRDSNVVRRIPDRMVPVGNPYYDWAAQMPRQPVSLRPAEFMDINKDFFERYVDSCSGCWPQTIGGRTYKAAHHLIDYVRIYDLPREAKVSDYPNPH